MNTKLFWPFSACVQHARKKCAFGFLFWPLGMALVLSLAYLPHAQGASLSGFVFFDGNHNGHLEMIGDWRVRYAKIQLYSTDKNGENPLLLKEMRTDMYGNYLFKDLAYGFYTVKDATPSSRGNTAMPGTTTGTDISLIDPQVELSWDSSVSEISKIQLTANSVATSFNFADDAYPIQIYSPYFQSSYMPHQIQSMPEPASIIQLGALISIALGGVVWHRRQRTS